MIVRTISPAVLLFGLIAFEAIATGCQWDGTPAPQSASAAEPTSPSPKLDEYGGFPGMASPNHAKKAFRLEKFSNKKWMFVDPDNNAFFMNGVYVLDQSGSTDELGTSFAGRTGAKYGDTGPAWAPAQLRRMQTWGFNTVGPFASVYALATHEFPTWPGDRSNPVKVPFLAFLRPSFYAMENENGWAGMPVKNMLAGVSPYYKGYRPADGVADYFDPNWEKFLANQLAHDGAEIKQSAYKRYMIGVSLDDSDDLFGFGAGPDFRTQPEAGKNNPHLGWLVLTASPEQSASAQYSAVYSDACVYTKNALHDLLVAKYGTIAALNDAWGSNYSTFGSSGSTIRGETVGTGSGTMASFTKTLAHTTVTRFSLQLLLAGAVVGGDLGDGRVWGPNLNGTIDYSTGALNITFPNAPKNGAAITVNYVQNGWGAGQGLMDEDGRPSHQGWVGRDDLGLSDARSTVRADLDRFLYEIAKHYFSVERQQIEAWLPGALFLGPTTLGTWSTPSNQNVLKAAGESLDAMAIGGGWPLSQKQLDFIRQFYGDKPIYVGAYRTANADSGLWRHAGGPGDFSTQAGRGQDYFNRTTALAAATYSQDGSRPYVGVIWWQYLDNRGERLNWGLVTLDDNAYDGHEAVPGRVSCSPPLENKTCGGEERSYGDLLTPVKNAHRRLFQLLSR